MAATQSRERSVVRDRLAEFFRDQKTRSGVLARRLLHIEAPDDAELVEHLIRERRRKTRMDGSLDGALLPTAWLAWELLQLETPTDNAGVVRTVGFLLHQQDQPGRVFGEGCRPYLHERQWCNHYVGGFFSAGPTKQPVAPATFPTGTVITEEPHARFAASCFALGAIALAPLDLRERGAQASEQVIARQEDDGSWRGADLFHALDMLLLVPTAEAREAVRHAVPPVCRLIRDGDTLTGDTGEERGLIVLRALAVSDGAS